MNKPSSIKKWLGVDHSLARRLPMIVGFISWSTPAVGYGIGVIINQEAYWASHPLGPNQVRCGTGTMLAFFMIFCVAPICGSIGAAIGWIIQGVYSD